MAGASDKARFYLEQSIPELLEFERKKIFNKSEITAITKKRSDFEHKLNGRGSQPIDYARYAQYEMNLESLRRKRTKRLSVKTTGHTGQRRILFVLDRATRKFHGDIALWMQYLQYAKERKAFKKIAEILTNVLRLHPTKAELWVYAANYAMEVQGDITEARSYMQRGLRFCKKSKLLWLEYTKLELIYIAKIAGRRHILGLDQDRSDQNMATESGDPSADKIILPVLTAEDIDPSLRIDDAAAEDSLKTLSTTPALSGAIACAIFDAAMEQFRDTELGEDFFDLVVQFTGLPCQGKLLQHIVDCLLVLQPMSPASLNCSIRQPLIGISFTSFRIPKALGVAIGRLRSAMVDRPKLKLLEKTFAWMGEFLKEEALDPDLRLVLSATMSKTLIQYLQFVEKDKDIDGNEFADALESAHQAGFDRVASLSQSALHIWPSNDRLIALSTKVSAASASAIDH